MSNKKDDNKNDDHDYIDFSEDPKGVVTIVFDASELDNHSSEGQTNSTAPTDDDAPPLE
ncbi:hypothetical protein QK958_003221 [Salmonella enterica]|nr:hypothetical protein [Salmonella enterica]